MDTTITTGKVADLKAKKNSNGTIWDYEAPQFCDFTSPATFAENDPNVDQFFLTDHESTKENQDFSFETEDGDGSSDADVFTTPMSVRTTEVNTGRKSTVSMLSDYATPKAQNGDVDSAKTPVNPRLSTLRPTPLREIYNQGGTPLYEAGHGVKVLKSNRKSRKLTDVFKKSAKKGKAPVVDAPEEEAVILPAAQPTGRETFDMGAVNEAIQEIVTQNGAVSEVKDATIAEPATVVDDGMLSEEEEDDVDKHEQTVLEQKTDEVESISVSVPAADAPEALLSEDDEESAADAPVEEEAVDFHNITDQELDEKLVLSATVTANQSAGISPNTSRRSSYIVKSPSVRVVHFADETSTNGSPALGSIGEAEETTKKQYQTTPVMHASVSPKKIKARQPTPMPGSTGEPVNRKSTSLLGALRNRLSKKYIKRFSKTMSPEEKKEADDQPTGEAQVKAKEPVAGPSSGAMVPRVATLVKKRVTIAALPSKTASTATNVSTVSKGKRNMSLKGVSLSGRFSGAAAATSSLARSKSLGGALSSATSSVTPSTSSKQSPYLGLNMLNQKFMNNYCRNYTPKMPMAWKPKVTIPKGPTLLTSQRSIIRKHHTMPNLRQEPVAKPKPVSRVAPQPRPTSKTPFVPTKAVTPKFCTDVRRKMWQSKPANRDQADSGAASSSHLFKARPAPNFKRIQAVEEKRKKEALEKAKQELKSGKMAPFSFESRAHGSSKP